MDQADAQIRIDAGERSVVLRRAVRDAAAKDRFIRANLRLVVSVAQALPCRRAHGAARPDQEGNLGLEHAVDQFDWRKGFSLPPPPHLWIRQAIGRALDQKGSLIRLPGDRSASLRAALRAASAEGFELDAQNAELHRLTSPTSLDRTIGDDGSELMDLVADAKPGPEAILMAREEDAMVTGLLDVLEHPVPASPSRPASASRTAASSPIARSATPSASPPRPPRRLVKRAVTPSARGPAPPPDPPHTPSAGKLTG